MVASKKTKFAKSRRKGWRKVNIDEVEQFYDDVRLKERVGQPLDQPEFTLDTKADIGTNLVKVKKTKKLKTTKDLTKNIKAYRSLVSVSKVPPVYVHKPEPVKEKIKDKVYGKSIKKKSENWTDIKVYDVWGDNNMPKQAEKRTRLKRPSVLPAVEPPHPGTSINPSIDDHQDLLKQAVDVELKKLKKEEHYKRVLDSFVIKKTPSQIQKEWLQEMSSGLPKQQKEESDEEEDSTNEEEGGLGPIKKIVRAEDRKPKSKRRREMLAKMREIASKKEKEEKRRANQIYQLKRLKKEVALEEEKAKKRKEILHKKYEDKLSKPARLGPHKFEEPEIPVNLPGELSARLRSVKTEGDLFEDRLKSLQKRNIIEPRKLILKIRKKNVKWTEKRDCRDNDQFN